MLIISLENSDIMVLNVTGKLHKTWLFRLIVLNKCINILIWTYIYALCLFVNVIIAILFYF